MEFWKLIHRLSFSPFYEWQNIMKQYVGISFLELAPCTHDFKVSVQVTELNHLMLLAIYKWYELFDCLKMLFCKMDFFSCSINQFNKENVILCVPFSNIGLLLFAKWQAVFLSVSKQCGLRQYFLDTSIKVYLQKHEYGKRKDVFFKGLKIKIIT